MANITVDFKSNLLLEPGHKDDLAGVEKVLREKLKRQVGLDQPRRRHQVQSGKETISLTKVNSKATKMPRYSKNRALGITGLLLL